MQWKGIAEFSNYAISTAGTIINIHTGKTLKPQIKRGYLTVNLYANGNMKTCLVHRLVAEAFLPNPLNLPEVNHKDENKANPCVSNLEWCSSSYNKKYSCGNKGKKVLQISNGEVVHKFASIGAAARDTGIPVSSISRCCSNTMYHKSAGGFEWRYAE